MHVQKTKFILILLEFELLLSRLMMFSMGLNKLLDEHGENYDCFVESGSVEEHSNSMPECTMFNDEFFEKEEAFNVCYEGRFLSFKLGSMCHEGVEKVRDRGSVEVFGAL